MDAALIERARRLLGDLSTWRLPPAAWSRPAAAVKALAAAYDAGDGAALKVALARLEVLSPNRVDRICEPGDGPPPELLRERVTALVHILTEPGDGEGAAAEAHGDDDRR
jgi:hypothetical protein